MGRLLVQEDLGPCQCLRREVVLAEDGVCRELVDVGVREVDRRGAELVPLVGAGVVQRPLQLAEEHDHRIHLSSKVFHLLARVGGELEGVHPEECSVRFARRAGVVSHHEHQGLRSLEQRSLRLELAVVGFLARHRCSDVYSSWPDL